VCWWWNTTKTNKDQQRPTTTNTINTINKDQQRPTPTNTNQHHQQKIHIPYTSKPDQTIPTNNVKQKYTSLSFALQIFTGYTVVFVVYTVLTP
jgi:hypothetical protein